MADRAKDRDERDHELPSAVSTAAPARNFTIPLDALVRAAAGPPAYSVRKRRIEDLHEQLVREIREVVVGASDLDSARSTLQARRSVERHVRLLAGLVADHNRFYPVEANLPMDPKSGAMLERGRPWRPLPAVTFDALFAQATGEPD